MFWIIKLFVCGDFDIFVNLFCFEIKFVWIISYFVVFFVCLSWLVNEVVDFMGCGVVSV